MKITYQATNFDPSLVTGKYFRVEGRKGNYTFKVFETATCWQKGQFYGKAGMGYTLREYITNGDELPEELKQIAIKTKQTMYWA